MGKEPNGNNKKTKSAPAKLSPKAAAELEQKREGRAKLWILIFAIVALVCIVAAIVAAILVNYFNNKRLDYIKDDLSRYVYLSKEDYSSFPIELYKEELTEIDVEDALMRKLAANRGKNPLYDGALLTSGVMSAGDNVNIFYRGYTLDENGVRNYFDGGSNFDDGPHSQVLGSSDSPMFVGFELGLIGRNPKNYSSYEIKTSGEVAEGDIIVVNYTVFYGDGSFKRDVTDIINLDEATLDSERGEGFREFFVGKEIGKELKGQDGVLIVSGENDIDTTYGDITVKKAIKVGKTPIVVTAYAPKSTNSSEIAGKTVYFDVFVKNFADYEVPLANDAFVTDTLKLTAEELAEYEGDTLINKYRSKLKSELIAERERADKALIEEAMWAYYLEKAEFKRLPKNEVKKHFDDYYDELYARYESYSYAYAGFDEFAVEALELEGNESWEDVLMADAESAVRDKLIFYYVIREEGLLPSEEEYNRLYNSAIEDHIVDYMDRAYGDKDFTLEEYNATVANVRIIVLDYYGEEYFAENAYYTYAIERVLEFADITYK